MLKIITIFMINSILLSACSSPPPSHSFYQVEKKKDSEKEEIESKQDEINPEKNKRDLSHINFYE